MYDNWGNQVETVDATGNVNRYAYNSKGQSTTSTNALGNSWSRSYDKLGRLTAVQNPYEIPSNTNTTSANKLPANLQWGLAKYMMLQACAAQLTDRWARPGG